MNAPLISPEQRDTDPSRAQKDPTVVYHGETIHAGGTNSTDADRVGIHMSYVVGWLRSEENNVLATPPDVARTLPPAAQRVLGYECHDAIELAGGYLGVVDLRNPAEMLASGEL